MMISVRIDHRDLIQDMKRLKVDLRKSARRIIKDVATEVVEESIKNIEHRKKTGGMKREIFEYPETAWRRIVVFGDATYLDEGSDPHIMPIKDTIIMSKFYDMHPDHFANYIKKHGTRAHPFIDTSFNNVMMRTDDIIRKELDRALRR